MSDAVTTARARIRDADQALVQAHPWLARDSPVALTFWLLALVALTLSAALWLSGLIPAVAAVLAVALALSVLHELEHDLIHDLYIPNPALRTVVLSTIWLAKGSIDPWSRGHMHRYHHIVSGQDEDVEERLIGLGMPWGPRRALLTLFPQLAALLWPTLARAVRARKEAGGRTPDSRLWRMPPVLALGNLILLGLPLLIVPAAAMGQSWALAALILWVLPNTIRHATIAFISSSSHYVGIQRGRVAEQNQILDHPLFWPLQLFCWNFGATHVLHHFVVQQPFWRRTIVFPQVRDGLVAAGVPRNDLGSFGRANRRPLTHPTPGSAERSHPR